MICIYIVKKIIKLIISGLFKLLNLAKKLMASEVRMNENEARKAFSMTNIQYSYGAVNSNTRTFTTYVKFIINETLIKIDNYQEKFEILPRKDVIRVNVSHYSSTMTKKQKSNPKNNKENIIEIIDLEETLRFEQQKKLKELEQSVAEHSKSKKR
ncbi:hypothetical protein RCL_jg5017.t1 [Rhizophagus clarus]|uniref:Uncharacterized protein n=1 Tax=Rhizophagus clarus TaxID=94130 RepID=A0A8H3LB36_9GLOM|nr:hypothetical protein RCL_jg5017.t1 [Rhizophagus clarus]